MSDYVKITNQFLSLMNSFLVMGSENLKQGNLNLFAKEKVSPDCTFAVPEDLAKQANVEPGIYEINLLRAVSDVSANTLDMFLSTRPCVFFNLKLLDQLVKDNLEVFYGKPVKSGHHPLEKGDYYLHIIKKEINTVDQKSIAA